MFCFLHSLLNKPISCYRFRIPPKQYHTSELTWAKHAKYKHLPCQRSPREREYDSYTNVKDQCRVGFPFVKFNSVDLLGYYVMIVTGH